MVRWHILRPTLAGLSYRLSKLEVPFFVKFVVGRSQQLRREANHLLLTKWTRGDLRVAAGALSRLRSCVSDALIES